MLRETVPAQDVADGHPVLLGDRADGVLRTYDVDVSSARGTRHRGARGCHFDRRRAAAGRQRGHDGVRRPRGNPELPRPARGGDATDQHAVESAQDREWDGGRGGETAQIRSRGYLHDLDGSGLNVLELEAVAIGVTTDDRRRVDLGNEVLGLPAEVLGFREDPDVAVILELMAKRGLRVDPDSASFFTSKGEIVSVSKPIMLWKYGEVRRPPFHHVE